MAKSASFVRALLLKKKGDFVDSVEETGEKSRAV